ncbi:MAG: type toxin-antitoxin system prevent-host-death family antitoxin [Deltaproteobacteria bacterium]|nr:type toxin-antitoxin system prevent-host-death family antitoxin [Deltaproteobacteria bacterium]
MNDTVAVSELKTHCLRLVEEVARHRRELIVTKRGKPIARLVPMGAVDVREALTRLRGTLIGGDRVEDFDTGAVWEATRR